jgi:hypothetical protein
MSLPIAGEFAYRMAEGDLKKFKTIRQCVSPYFRPYLRNVSLFAVLPYVAISDPFNLKN